MAEKPGFPSGAVTERVVDVHAPKQSPVPTDMAGARPADGAASLRYELDLEHIFTYHTPRPDQLPRYAELRQSARDFAECIVRCVPWGADQAAAIRLVREAVMTANAAVALDGRLTRAPYSSGS